MDQGVKRCQVWSLILALSGLHFALALAYAFVTPYCTPGVTNGRLLPDIGAPDERAHAEYVRHLFRGEGLPVLRPEAKDLGTTYESHQPPLYYWLAAQWSRLWGVSDPVASDQGVRVRSLNAVLGAATVAGTFFLAWWALRRHDLAVCAAAIAALLPMLCAVDGAVRNESLLICLCTWALALMARWAGAWTPWRALLLGALIGAAILTKSTGVLLLPAAACALLIGGRRQGIVPAIVAVFVAVGLAMPVFLRNHALYGDVLGMKAFYAAYPATVDASAVFSQPRALAHWLYVLGAGTALSFVGEFGYMDIHLPYWIYIPLIGMVALALIRSIRRGQDGAGKEVRVAFQAFVWGVALLYVVFNLRYVQPQARYVFPAIGVLALWTVAGAARMHRHAPAALAGALLFANLYALAVLPGQFRERVEAVSGPQTPASFLKHSSASPGYFSRSISLVKMKSSRW